MGRRQERVYHVEPEEFPQDFPERLDRFRQAAGLSWRELARRLKVNARIVRRWKAGAKPGIGHQATVVEGDLDPVGVVAWQHLFGAPFPGPVFCFKTIIPDSGEHTFASSGGLSHAPVRWIGAKGRPL